MRRCDEMERKLRYLSNELEKADIEVRPSATVEAPDPQSKFWKSLMTKLTSKRIMGLL